MHCLESSTKRDYRSTLSLYNGFPTIITASKALPKLEKLVLPELSTLLLEHKLQTQFAIALVHKHFDLIQESERVVNLPAPSNLVVASVFVNDAPNPAVVAEYDLEIPTSPSIIGTTFLVQRNALVPYEYCCVNPEEAAIYADIASHVHPDFCFKWREVLEKYDFMDCLGLQIVRPEIDDEKIGYETHDSDRRLQFTVHEADSIGRTGYIATSWRIQDNGRMRRNTDCYCSD